MLFNSLDFAVFLPLVFLIYWFVVKKSLCLQNAFLVLSSYVFYGFWDKRFLLLIIFSSLVDFLVGIGFSKTNHKNKRKILLATSLIVNLGLLGFFKYFNFFAESFADAFTLLGKSMEVECLEIILPVGISFYTFQTLSYSLDLYKGKLKPTKDIVSFLAFVSFFPQLVAGPIERATKLLPQFHKARTFDYSQAVDGLRQILWGLFKKMVIADNCAEYANIAFNNSADMSGGSMALGIFFFSLQIYGDFSGYSDIAIGTSRLFGFKLMQNFNFPYFSRDAAEFWRRWHISLSTWFRDYLYIPLGGSRGSILKKIRNIFIIFIVSGFWHGDKWTFIIWGALNALFFLPLMLMNKNRSNLNTVAENKLFPSVKELGQMLITFILISFAWIFFRAENLVHAFDVITQLFSSSIFDVDFNKHGSMDLSLPVLMFLIFLFFILEWLGRTKQYAIEHLGLNWKRPFRWSFYCLIAFCIFWFGQNQQEFIYFQF